MLPHRWCASCLVCCALRFCTTMQCYVSCIIISRCLCRHATSRIPLSCLRFRGCVYSMQRRLSCHKICSWQSFPGSHLNVLAALLTLLLCNLSSKQQQQQRRCAADVHLAKDQASDSRTCIRSLTWCQVMHTHTHFHQCSCVLLTT